MYFNGAFLLFKECFCYAYRVVPWGFCVGNRAVCPSIWFSPSSFVLFGLMNLLHSEDKPQKSNGCARTSTPPPWHASFFERRILPALVWFPNEVEAYRLGGLAPQARNRPIKIAHAWKAVCRMRRAKLYFFLSPPSRETACMVV